MNSSTDNHYNEHRSLSSTTQYATPYSQYHSMQHVAQAQYAAEYPSHTYSAGQPSPYATPASIAHMPAYTMQASTSYPGATAHPSLQVPFSDGRGVSAPGGQAYAGHTQYASQTAGNPQYLQQQMYPSAQYGESRTTSHHSSTSHASRYQPTPAQTLQQHSSLSSPTYSRVQAPPSPSGERFSCEKCEKTFSRAHDRKRHYESQHSPQPITHRCPYCRKEFSRADSMKRHVDNGCEKDPSYTAGIAS